ncbi:MAG TPA: ImmA/IrrE family metallo-endopeptidase [Thermoleophilaceae bacterium]|nr:ImmA/IrrE family metallo-endopeptidase [Thermoleophilaceae bacterium]
MSGWPVADPTRPPTPDQALELARRARGALADDDRALHIGRACELARVKTLTRPLPVGSGRHTAMLLPEPDGFRAVVDSTTWHRAQHDDVGRRRLRFVLAHELGHTLFYEAGSPPRRTRPSDEREESFCDRFAMLLLVPQTVAGRTVADPDRLRGLATRYDVSLRLAAWAVTEAQPDLTLLMLRHGPHPRRGGDETMRTEWGANQQHFIAKGESFKSALADLAPGEYGQSFERLRLSGRERDYEIQAWRSAGSMLVALRERDATQSRPPSTRQLTLFK